MDFKIIWSEFAEFQLEEIYNYYAKKASRRIATKLITGIINEPQRLQKTPNAGQVENFLEKRDIDYRYLIYKNYKLIYSVDQEKGYIKIADVFDTRQNPIKIGRNK